MFCGMELMVGVLEGISSLSRAPNASKYLPELNGLSAPHLKTDRRI